MARPHCCDEFSRSALVRRAVAQAGAGLPAIEPGMPLPAGTGLDRRAFLSRSAALALTVYGASRLPLPGLDDGIARAAAGAAPAERTLVSIFLPGGMDSMSTLYPAGDPLYRKLRPRLALPEGAGQAFAEDERLRWHPAAAKLAALHGEGKVSVLPAIGYTHADQSHFTSRHFWEVGATETRLTTGWLGRYLDAVGVPDNPLQGVSLDGELQPALASARVPVAAISRADSYDFWTYGVWGEVGNRMFAALDELAGAGYDDPALAQAASVAAQSNRLRSELAQFQGGSKSNFGSSAPYPSGKDPFPQRLAGLAAMLAAGLPIRVAAVTAPGQWDTHADQPAALQQGLSLAMDSVYAFQRDLEARGLADRVLTLVWTEFGRRAAENGSNGTDHGAAGAAFVIGSQARGRMIGEFPGLAKGLDEDGNLRPTSDFRGLYRGLLEQWLETDAAAVIPGARSFAAPVVVR